MKKLISIVFVLMISATANAGPIDWCFNQIGYAPEKIVDRNHIKIGSGKNRDSDVGSVSMHRLQSMITSANLTALGSFGIAFLLAGIFIDKIRDGI